MSSTPKLSKPMHFVGEDAPIPAPGLEGAGPESTRHRRMRGIACARELLHSRSSEALTLDELVLAAGCKTQQRLIRGFRVAFGLTPHQYLTKLRLEQARHLLTRGRTCGETALTVGFYDQSQMNRHFVRHFGVTPGAYAKAALGKRRVSQMSPDA